MVFRVTKGNVWVGFAQMDDNVEEKLMDAKEVNIIKN
jgi:hypothetical protein